MSGPSTPSPSYSGDPETLLARVQQLLHEAEAFRRTVDEELCVLLEELKDQQATRRRHGR